MAIAVKLRCSFGPAIAPPSVGRVNFTDFSGIEFVGCIGGCGSTIGFVGKSCCCCAVGMCGNSRQRVIHISMAAVAIFLASQVAVAVVGG